MSHPNLDNLVRIGLLKVEPGVASELEGLVRSGTARLADAKNEALSLDGRFDLAYNAGHALALAALRWHGYRPDNKRFIVFQALEHTLDLPASRWRVLAQAHEKRNRSEYEGIIDVDRSTVDALIRIVDEVATCVRQLAPL